MLYEPLNISDIIIELHYSIKLYYLFYYHHFIIMNFKLSRLNITLAHINKNIKLKQ